MDTDNYKTQLVAKVEVRMSAFDCVGMFHCWVCDLGKGIDRHLPLQATWTTDIEFNIYFKKRCIQKNLWLNTRHQKDHRKVRFMG